MSPRLKLPLGQKDPHSKEAHLGGLILNPYKVLVFIQQLIVPGIQVKMIKY